MSFHNDVSKCARYHAGDVLRLFDGPFGDGVVLGFDDEDNAHIQRPYAYASGVGTTGPNALLGSERIIYRAIELPRFAKVGDKRTTT
jgi:hypothetical protein